ncbi:uncharacterized protein CLUP02_17889 [Colletotrichum lupini]|uniref:Uncharacterized protein n=1 Tax=Colletotrichum lupini TaxID=145971 RepID=A0A9Q8SGA8_9PEZI|nr:uncharacterized protein CLUP02_17889 [Colletotrichum lupini]KAK1715199.1 hypothetical protein BDP67DRAFT_511866 [Colletotrichum lupini]UQC76376.1 hypothetical protein CLUP02_17889 [Colletotrichum lupini]
MAEKTYFLAPNFDFPPGSSILLGSLISDPLTPHRSLAQLEKWPDVTTIVDKEAVISRGKGNGANISLGAQMLGAIGAKIGGGVEKSRATEYRMSALKTEFFTRDPGEDEIKKLIAECPRARKVLIDAPIWRPGKLFIITGLKIAEEFSMSSTTTGRREGDVEGTAPVLAAAGLNVEAGIGSFFESSEGMSLEAVGDRILAYRLVKISLKGLKRKELEIDEYRSNDIGKMLGHREDEIDEQSLTSIEVADALEDDLDSDDDDEMDAVEVITEVDSDEGHLRVVSA